MALIVLFVILLGAIVIVVELEVDVKLLFTAVLVVILAIVD